MKIRRELAEALRAHGLEPEGKRRASELVQAVMRDAGPQVGYRQARIAAEPLAREVGPYVAAWQADPERSAASRDMILDVVRAELHHDNERVRRIVRAALAWLEAAMPCPDAEPSQLNGKD